MATPQHDFISPKNVSAVGGFMGRRFEANRVGRLKDPILSEEYIRRHERKDHMEWFWAGEQIGKWFDAASYTGLIAGDAALLDRVEELLARLEKTQEEDGAISITARRNRVPARGMELYENYYVLHGLLVCHELLGSERALRMATRLGDYIIQTWGAGPGQIPLAGRFPGNGHGGGEGTLILEPIALLGKRTGEARFLEWCEQTVYTWDAWLAAYPESRFTCSLTMMKEFASGQKQVYELRPGIHAHTFHMTLLGLGALYEATGNPEYREVMLGCVNRLADEWIFLTGGMSAEEGYIAREYYHPRGDIEVCPQHTWILMLAQAYQWTGEARYLAEIERDLFNHFLAAQLADGTNWSYMTPLQGRSQEPETPNCCNASGKRIAGRMPVYLYGWHSGSPAVLLFSASQGKLTLDDGVELTLKQETDFPASGAVTVCVSPSSPARFALHVRIPPYARGAHYCVNGEAEQAAPAGEFLVIEREWRAGDQLQLTLPMTIEARVGGGQAAILRGPLVYAYFQKAQPDPRMFIGRRGQYPEDVVLQLKTADGSLDVTETTAPEGMLGPALLARGYVKAKPPMFAQSGANRLLPEQKPSEFLLLPFANQGAYRGDYSVFLDCEE